MKACCGTYFRISAIIVSVAVCLLLHVPGNTAYADYYEFTWTANHANDNVAEYEIYYRSTASDGYNSCDFVTIENSYPGYPYTVNEGFTLDEISEGYCFAIKAVDEDDFRSDFSDNEDGRIKKLCDKNPNVLPFDEEDNCVSKASSSSGGGGGCFLNQVR